MKQIEEINLEHVDCQSTRSVPDQVIGSATLTLLESTVEIINTDLALLPDFPCDELPNN